MKRRSKRLSNLDKTHITCALTPRRTAEKLPKVYSIDNNDREETENESQQLKPVLKSKEDLKIKEKATIKMALKSKKHKTDSKSKTLRSEKNGNKISSDRRTIDLEENVAQEELKHSLNPNISLKPVERCASPDELLASNESETEVIISDNECNCTLKQLETTANSKRLRRSLIALNSAKRKKLSNSKLATGINSFKLKTPDMSFENNLKKNFKLRKCKVRLKRVQQTAKLQTEIEIEKPPTITENNTLGVNLETNIEYKSEISKTLENLKNILKYNFENTEANKVTEIDSSPINIFYDDVDESFNVENIETPPRLQELRLNRIYDRNKSLESPSLFTDNSSPILIANKDIQFSKTPSRSNSVQTETCITLSSSNSNHSLVLPESKCILTPMDLPPSPDEVLKGCCKLQLPEYEFQQPFYSNSDDITKYKELGFTILQIPGNKLNDVEEFQSILGGDLKGLTAWRRNKLLQLGGPEVLNKYRNTQRIREYFANQKTIVITPQMEAPTRQEVKLWLKAREVLQSKGQTIEDLNKKHVEEDSPIKIRRQKVTMMLNAEEGQANSDGDDDNGLDCTSRNLTLTPLTPGTPQIQSETLDAKIKQDFTPVTTHMEKVKLKPDSSIEKRKNLRILKRLSLNKQFKEAYEKQSQSSSKQSSQESEVIKNSQESQKSENSITSSVALAELERSSFMRHIQQHDVTINEGFSENSTLNHTFGFKVALENLQQAKSDVEVKFFFLLL